MLPPVLFILAGEPFIAVFWSMAYNGAIQKAALCHVMNEAGDHRDADRMILA